MNSAAGVGGIFIFLDVTALAFTQYINMRKTGPWEADWIVISSEEATGLAGFVYFRSCFENVHTTRSRDTVRANSGSIPRPEKAFGIQKLRQNVSSKYAT